MEDDIRKLSKKVQVLLAEQQLKDLEETASQQKKKIGTWVREAIEEYHLKKKKEQQIAHAVNRILSLPEVLASEDYQKWEAEYLKRNIHAHELALPSLY